MRSTVSAVPLLRHRSLRLLLKRTRLRKSSMMIHTLSDPLHPHVLHPATPTGKRLSSNATRTPNVKTPLAQQRKATCATASRTQSSSDCVSIPTPSIPAMRQRRKCQRQFFPPSSFLPDYSSLFQDDPKSIFASQTHSQTPP